MKRIVASLACIVCAGVMLCAMVGPQLAAAGVTHHVVVEISDATSTRRSTIMLTQAQTQEIREIIDDVHRKVSGSPCVPDQLEAYQSAVDLLYPYGVFGGLSRDQAQRLVSFWYRVPSQAQGYERPVSLFNKNLFCYVSGQSTLTYTGRLLPIFFVFIGLVIAFSGFFFAHPYPGPIGLLLIGLGSMIANAGYALVSRADLMPIPICEFFSTGFWDWQRDKYVYATGNVTTVGLLGVHAWHGEMRGNLRPAHLRVNDFYEACPSMYGFSGVKIWLTDDGNEKSFLGSALMVGLTEGESELSLSG